MSREKQRLIAERPSDRAVRLANDIYFTYLYEDSPSLHIPLTRLCEVFGNHDMLEVKKMVEIVFAELNEPIVLSDCSFQGKNVEWMLLEFFTYEFSVIEGNVYIELEINEKYLHALETLDDEPYINFQ